MACQQNGVCIEGTLLKPSMTIQGTDCKKESTPEQVAGMTVSTMERAVQASVPGIAFLSGGLSEEAASVYQKPNEQNLEKSILEYWFFLWEGIAALMLKKMEWK